MDAVKCAEACVAVPNTCPAFRISESSYRSERTLDDENVEMANWLLRLTDNYCSWRFCLYYLFLCSVRRFTWNHKRVCRICKDPGLNLRITPRERLVREKPGALTVPQGINYVWSLVFCTASAKTAERFGCRKSLTTSTARPLAKRWASPGPLRAGVSGTQADHLFARKAAGDTVRQRLGLYQFGDSKLGP